MRRKDKGLTTFAEKRSSFRLPVCNTRCPLNLSIHIVPIADISSESCSPDKQKPFKAEILIHYSVACMLVVRAKFS